MTPVIFATASAVAFGAGLVLALMVRIIGGR